VHLRRDTNDTASGTGTGVASLEGLLVVALAEIVSAGVDNDGTTNDGLGADELDELVGHGALGVALGISLEVAEVTNVADLVGRSTVGLAVGVEVRAGRSAAVGVVTEGVDVEATLGVGVVAGDVPGDGGGRALGLLLEHNGAGDLGVSTEDSDSLDHFDGF
jgi:hypothetical protein